jgi:hypothetical protein
MDRRLAPASLARPQTHPGRPTEAHTVIANAWPGRPIVVSVWGLDMEVDFKNDNHQHTGRRIWLQLKVWRLPTPPPPTRTPTSSGSTKRRPLLAPEAT